MTLKSVLSPCGGRSGRMMPAVAPAVFFVCAASLALMMCGFAVSAACHVYWANQLVFLPFCVFCLKNITCVK